MVWDTSRDAPGFGLKVAGKKIHVLRRKVFGISMRSKIGNFADFEKIQDARVKGRELTRMMVETRQKPNVLACTRCAAVPCGDGRTAACARSTPTRSSAVRCGPVMGRLSTSHVFIHNDPDYSVYVFFYKTKSIRAYYMLLAAMALELMERCQASRRGFNGKSRSLVFPAGSPLSAAGHRFHAADPLGDLRKKIALEKLGPP